MLLPRKRLKTVTPSILSAAVSYFGNGRVYPAGTYTIRYEGGVMGYIGAGNGWSVGDPVTAPNGFYIVRETDFGARVRAPQSEVLRADPVVAQGDSYAVPSVSFTLATEGRIGVYLDDDYLNQVAGPWRNPSFSLSRAAAAASVPWSPSQLSSLVGWFRSDSPKWQDIGRSIPAVAEGDRIGAWDDVSGNNNHLTQATAGRRPTLVLGGINGLPLVSCDETFNNWLSRAGVGGMLQGNPLFVWMVTRPYTAGRLSGVGSTEGNGVHLRLFSGTQVGVVSTAGFTDSTVTIFPGGTIAGQWLRLAGLLPNPASRSIAVNGGAPSTAGGVSAPPNQTGLAIGADFSGGSGFGWMTQEVAEVIFAAAVPDAGGLLALDNYAKTRYAL